MHDLCVILLVEAYPKKTVVEETITFINILILTLALPIFDSPLM